MPLGVTGPKKFDTTLKWKWLCLTTCDVISLIYQSHGMQKKFLVPTKSITLPQSHYRIFCLLWVRQLSDTIHSFKVADRSLIMSAARACCTLQMCAWCTYMSRPERTKNLRIPITNPSSGNLHPLTNLPWEAALSCLRPFKSNSTCSADSSFRPHFLHAGVL